MSIGKWLVGLKISLTVVRYIIMKKNKNIINYFKNIKTLLPIKGNSEKKYLNGFKQNLSEFSDEYPEASYQDIIREFGEPKDVVVSYLNNCEENYLIKKLRLRSIVSRVLIVLTIIALCLALWYSYLFYIGYHESKEQRIDNCESIITEE